MKLSDRLVNDLDASWDETVTPDLGIPSYETLLGCRDRPLTLHTATMT